MKKKKKSNISPEQNSEPSTFKEELLKQTKELYRQGREYLKKHPLPDRLKKIKPVH